MARLSASFRCFNGCSGSFPLTQAIYRCPTCDGLLEVAHELDALRETSGSAWRALFDRRWSPSSSTGNAPSGVWSKREWVAPEVPDDAIVTTGEGMTPLYPARRLATELGFGSLFVKQCGTTHTGSFKDLG